VEGLVIEITLGFLALCVERCYSW